ncbi:MAG: DUF2961 domain-containing protein [Chloroflexi bacterium]|nr:DUF2961 domain-containing protein [Chloroflexota bacterium]
MLLNNRQFGLGALPVLGDFETRSISAENPDGSRAGGAKAEPQGPRDPARELGKSWKVRPCITLDPGSLTTLADIKGQGLIQHIWITVDPKAYRDCVLRMYWDGEETPSVEVPVGDFFACGHGLRTNITSLAVAVNPSGGFNCYWPMPFYQSARITIENQRDEAIDGFFYQITYALGPLPADLGAFHAQWRISTTQRDYPEHVILEGVQGNGQYVGTYLAWTQMSDGWWGEGEIKFFMDGDTEYPTICGTGTEDYFCGAWGFGDTFTGPYTGYPLWQRENERVPKHGLYRWHIMDPIRFHKDLKVTMQALGWWPGGKFQPLTDEIASVGYWYQQEPHAAFPQLPSRNGRLPR